MNNKFYLLIILIAMTGDFLFAETNKLPSGQGLYFCDASNTFGKGNVWINGHGRAFYWDNTKIETGYPLKIFPCLGINAGLFEFWDVGFSSEMLSYGFKIPGYVKLRSKITFPNNKSLRLFGFSLNVSYKKNFLDDYPSIGYRNDMVGFYSEGIMYSKDEIEVKLIGDVEFIKWKSILPLKAYVNIGYLFSSNRAISDYDQYVFSTGIEYKGLNTDFFLEYSIRILKGFGNPKTIKFTDKNGYTKTFPHFFIENPMYITPGVRVKYSNGLILFAGAAIKLSMEKGYELGPVYEPLQAIVGYTDGFSPFYADWKLVGKISFPIRFKITNSELIRKFLLMKNKSGKKVIDIDQEIKDLKQENEKKQDDEKVLEKIKKRREKLMEEDILD